MQFYARDIMSDLLVTARPEMTTREARDLLLNNGISGVPVVNDRGVLVGILTMVDVLRAATAEIPLTATMISDDLLEEMLGERGLHAEQPLGFISDYMTREVATCLPDTPVEDLARRMFQHKIHRIVVLKPNEQIPIGVVTTFDLLKLLAEAPSTAEFLAEPASKPPPQAKERPPKAQPRKRGEPMAYREP